MSYELPHTPHLTPHTSYRFLLSAFCFLLFLNCNAQTDSTKVKYHNPKTASWLALIPGAGQIYNKKYWKLPIVYGGLGATTYLIYRFQKETSLYKKEFLARSDYNDNKENSDFIDKRNPELEDRQDAYILQQRDINRRNMEISIAACTIVYFLSILDASVDAHLYYYDVSDNLAIGIKPKINMDNSFGTPTPCLALVLKF